MFEINEGNTANRLVTSSYVKCARNITSGNLFVNKAHYLIKKVKTGIVDDKFVLVGDTTSTKCYQSEYNFGQCVTVSVAGVLEGQDYLGNTIVENVTANTATKHAFFKVLKFTATNTVSGTAVTLTATGIVGLEFQTAKVDNVIVDGVDTVASVTVSEETTTNWTFAGFDNTQTGSSDGDTRGTVDLSSQTGKEVEILYTVTEYCIKDEKGNDLKGGLFGVLPYAG